jgi:DNA helicase II / ATP-dependent DNA helicase PcrA
MVLAGAGSGKTRVITYRIAHLLARGEARPHNVLAVTFTNKAAREMRERVCGLLGRSERDLWVSTFHSACARILRGHAHLLAYNRDFSIYDDRDQMGLVEGCRKELNLDGERFPARMLLSRISQAKQEFLDPEQLLARSQGDYLDDRVARVYELYQQRLRQAQAMDFDDLLFQTLRLFETHAEVLAHYRQRWLHVLVDEFQDTNHIQYRLVKALTEVHRNLCVVGDDDQSIYSWRGADLTNILGFEKDFPDTHVVRLEQNYRSTQRILEASGAVIEKNFYRKGKRLWTENEPGEPVSMYRAVDERDEAIFVVDEVRQLVSREGLRSADVAVFYRTHAQSRVLEEEFLDSRLPFSIYGGPGFYERKEVKDLVAYLRALVHPSDDASWKRILNVPRRGIGKTTREAVETLAIQERINFSEALRRFAGVGPKRSGAQARVQAFLEMMDRLTGKLSQMGIRDGVEAVLWESGYLEELGKDRSSEARDREENLQELVNLVAEYASEEEEGGLSGFLERIALVSDVDRMDDKEDRVTLMTLHSAKGLEFPVVFLVGLEEGLLPHSSALKDEGELEEERRLCYVGMTRAEKRLYLSHAASRRVWGSIQYLSPSRFLGDIPRGCLEACSPDALEGVESDEDRSSEAAAVVGRWVRHKAFGVGTVQRIEQDGARVVIHFPGAGEKRFATNQAPLEWL